MSKSSTKRIVLFEPDSEQLNTALEGREISLALLEFLKNLLKTKKWPRKINIPSGSDDVAAVLVFTTALRERGFEILSELHVFYGGKVMVEKWEVVGETEQISLLPKEALQAIDVEKVRVEGPRVTVEFSAPFVGGRTWTLVKTFDFSEAGNELRFVPHPLLEAKSD